eukprot:TRINITY_DN3701_c0_g1_i1.p1 TRINITY_DN3701_c0_g1~~TRINITY_DN3701_c0_g1_i1.p1  ORF type:complete len:105 (+),score=6.04 TRINITY_DN3701_c0_g1_i1:221-535(+)
MASPYCSFPISDRNSMVVNTTSALVSSTNDTPSTNFSFCQPVYDQSSTYIPSSVISSSPPSLSPRRTSSLTLTKTEIIKQETRNGIKCLDNQEEDQEKKKKVPN